jgi:transposase
MRVPWPPVAGAAAWSAIRPDGRRYQAPSDGGSRSHTLGHDRSQLANMAQQAKTAMAISELAAIADRGYFSSEEIRQCEESGITALVPKCVTSGAKADGRFDKADFIYDAPKNEYQCPAGQRLIWRFATVEHGLTLNKYWSSHCPQCPIKSQCTPFTLSSFYSSGRWC